MSKLVNASMSRVHHEWSLYIASKRDEAGRKVGNEVHITDTLSAEQVRQPYDSGTKLRDKPYSDYYAALRAWRRELLQTFFSSTVWMPSLSLGA